MRLLSFWHGSAELSFVAFNLDLCRTFNDVCDGEFGVVVGGAASDASSNGKTRYGPFVSFMNDGVYRNYEGSCV